MASASYCFFGLNVCVLATNVCVSKCVSNLAEKLERKNLILAQPVFRPLLLPLCTAVDTTILPTTAQCAVCTVSFARDRTSWVIL